MADISNQLITKIVKGVPVRFYISPTVNTDGSLTLSTAGGLDATAHPNAKEIGYTQDGVELTRGAAFEDLIVDQSTEPILQSLTSQDVHLKTKILQIRDFANMVKLTPGSSAMTGTGFSGISDQKDQSFLLTPVCAIAPTPNDATKFMYIILYAAFNVAPFNVMLAKKYNVTAVDLKAHDAGRADGRTWAFIETL